MHRWVSRLEMPPLWEMSTQFQVEHELQIHFLSEGSVSPGKNVLLCPLLTAWPIAGISIYYIVSLVCMSPFPHQTVNQRRGLGFIYLGFPVQQAWYPRRSCLQVKWELVCIKQCNSSFTMCFLSFMQMAGVSLCSSKVFCPVGNQQKLSTPCSK